ncbi:MAG: adenosylmethionine decarboxylase [bacterium]
MSGKSHKVNQEHGFAKHIILELWEANNTDSAKTIEKALRKACHEGNLDLVKIFIHRFSPHGVSGVAIIHEAHITIHTWPEHRVVAVDIYSSNAKTAVERLAEIIRGTFSPCQVNQVSIHRGKPKV